MSNDNYPFIILFDLLFLMKKMPLGDCGIFYVINEPYDLAPYSPT